MSKSRKLRGYYQTISAMGKQAMAKKKAEGVTMNLAPLGFLNDSSKRLVRSPLWTRLLDPWLRRRDCSEVKDTP